jgi:exonuclease VII large subunit
MVRDARGAIILDSADLHVGERLDITFAHGWARVELTEKGEGFSNTESGVNKR